MPPANQRPRSTPPLHFVGVVHRWAGGTIGVILVLLSLTGTTLLHRNAWLGLLHGHDAPIGSASALGSTVSRIMRGPHHPISIQFGTREMGLSQLTYADGAGAYANQQGAIVARWRSQWARPELWLFDLHRHLLAGEGGEIVAGIAAFMGLLLLATGSLLWWRTRSTYEFRLLPRRTSRPAIIRYHRDLGIVAAPFLAFSLLTAIALVFLPHLIGQESVGTRTAIGRALSPPPLPKNVKEPIPANFDWQAIFRTAQARFPTAQIRGVSVGIGEVGPILIRVQQPGDWQPNGATILWFASDGGLIAVRDAATFPRSAKVYEAIFPLHSGAVGGLAYRLVLSLVGILLTLIGAMAVWSFWFHGPMAPGSRKGKTRR